MSLLDQLKSATDGVKSGAGVVGVPAWRPSKERTHPEAIEGVIADVGKVAVREPKENGPTEDLVLTIVTADAAWRVFGSTRDLRDKFGAIERDGNLVPGTKIAVKFFGTRKEKAKDGTPYTVHSYAVAAEPGDVIPLVTGHEKDGTPIWNRDGIPF